MARAKSPAHSAEFEQVKHSEQKWTKTLWKAGFTSIPSVLLLYQKQLGLSPTDLNILLQIVKHWWYRDNLPRPSKRTIAEAIGMDQRTVGRHLAALEKRNYITRVPRFEKYGGQGANEYSLGGLIEAAKPYAQEELEKREKRRKEDDVSKRPRGFRPKVIEGRRGKK